MKQIRFIKFGVLLLFAIGLVGCETDIVEPTKPTFGNATVVPFDDVVTGKIDTKADYYKVVTAETGVTEIVVSSIPESVGLRISTFDTQEKPIATQTVGTGKSFQAEYLAEATTYYIKVELAYGTPSSDTYQVQANFDNSDKNEMNNTFETATPVELGTVATGAVYGKGDIDYYKFTTTETGVFELTVSSIPENIQLRMTLFDAQKVEVNTGKGNCCYDTSQAYSVQQLSEAATYYLRIERVSNAATPTPYEVRFALDTSDTNELNNSFDTATPLSQDVTTQGAIYGNGDTDYYIFTAPSAGDYNFILSGVPNGIGLIAEVFNSQKVSIKSGTAAENRQSEISVTAEANETFYLQIRLNGFTYTPDKYDVVVNKL